MKNRKIFIILTLTTVIIISSCYQINTKTTEKQIQGWTILSENRDKALKVIRASKEYRINHLQLSHKIVHKLKHLRRDKNRTLTNALIDSAHAAGIDEVVLWDHALYWLGYYPDKFKTGPDSTLNLDNQELWKWIKQDYRDMLDLAPNADGIVLTFIETGAHIEDQYSEKLTSDAQKLALLVNELSKVIIDERNLKLYIRTFIYFPHELEALLECLNLIDNKNITVMCKEVPHDFFLTHPKTYWVKDIDFPVVIEFDCAHEYNGQGVVASIFPQVHVKRFKYFKSLPNVVGYVARTDRYKESAIIGKPSEINLFALYKTMKDTSTDIDNIYNSFITREYGAEALPYLKPAFKKSYDMVTSIWYTLGLPLNHHSRITFEDVWSYSGLVSGRWMEKPVVMINHNVNKEFHYWIDLVNHLAPPDVKKNKGYLGENVLKDKIEKNWLDTTEQMNMEYLMYIIQEKDYAVNQSDWALTQIEKAKDKINDTLKYDILYNTFKRTELSAKLYRGVAKAYFGSRVWNSNNSNQSLKLRKIIISGLVEAKETAEQIKNYPNKGARASYIWENDADNALDYVNRVSNILKK